MKVKDLIEQLKTLDQNLQVYCHFDGNISDGDQSNIYDIENVSAPLAERDRGNNGRPTIKFTHDDKMACPTAILSITNDF